MGRMLYFVKLSLCNCFKGDFLILGPQESSMAVLTGSNNSCCSTHLGQ